MPSGEPIAEDRRQPQSFTGAYLKAAKRGALADIAACHTVRHAVYAKGLRLFRFAEARELRHDDVTKLLEGAGRHRLAQLGKDDFGHLHDLDRAIRDARRDAAELGPLYVPRIDPGNDITDTELAAWVQRFASLVTPEVARTAGAIAQFTARTGRRRFALSTRTLSVEAVISEATARRHLDALVKVGALRVIAAHKMREGKAREFMIPRAAQSDAPTDQGLDGIGGVRHFVHDPDSVLSPGHDYWNRDRSGWQILTALATLRYATLSEVAALARRHGRTVLRVLRRLAADGLVAWSGGRWRYVENAETPEVEPHRERRIERHRIERALFARVREEWNHRAAERRAEVIAAAMEAELEGLMEARIRNDIDAAA